MGVHAGEGHTAHYSGLERCASVWACPVCAAVIRSHRADEIGRAWQANVETGGSGLFVTLTLRHQDGDDLAAMLDHLLGAWRKVQTWRAWRGSKTGPGWRDRLDVRGIIRATEVTHGRNGWHPHSHLLVVTGHEPSETEREAFRAWLSAAWQKAVTAAGGRLPSDERGVDVRLVTSEGVTSYLTKMQDEKSTGVARELARGDLKHGRGSSRLPFELLDGMRAADRGLWLEYVRATHGRRAFSWTRGLRELLLPDEEEASDEEVIEDSDAAPQVVTIDGEAWDQRFRDDPARMARVLELADAADERALLAEVGTDVAGRQGSGGCELSAPPWIPAHVIREVLAAAGRRRPGEIGPWSVLDPATVLHDRR